MDVQAEKHLKNILSEVTYIFGVRAIPEYSVRRFMESKVDSGGISRRLIADVGIRHNNNPDIKL